MDGFGDVIWNRLLLGGVETAEIHTLREIVEVVTFD